MTPGPEIRTGSKVWSDLGENGYIGVRRPGEVRSNRKDRSPLVVGEGGPVEDTGIRGRLGPGFESFAVMTWSVVTGSEILTGTLRSKVRFGTPRS